MSSEKWRPFCVGLNVLKLKRFNHIAVAVELCLFCIKPFMCCYRHKTQPKIMLLHGDFITDCPLHNSCKIILQGYQIILIIIKLLF